MRQIRVLSGRIVAACVLTLASIIPAAPAETAPAADPNAKPATADTVVVEGKLPFIPTSNAIFSRFTLPLRLIPANVGTVNELLLKDQKALVLGDALRNVSGANVHTVTNVADSFLIRGFDSLNNSLVMTDGVTEPEVPFYQMYNVERVEVLKGPGGFLYGRNPFSKALGSAVNIVRRQPTSGRFGQVGTSAGSFGTYDTTLDYNAGMRDDSVLFRINSTWRQSDFYRDEKEYRTMAVNPAMTWRISSRSSLNVNLEYIEADHQPDNGLPIHGGEIADVPRERSYQSPFDDSRQEVGRIQVDFETRISDRWSLRNKSFARGMDWRSNGTFFNGVFPSMTTGRPEVSRSLILLDDQQRFAGNMFEAVLTGATGPVRHRMMMGVEASRFDDRSSFDVAFLPSIDLTDPDETASGPLTSIPGQASRSNQRSLVVAPYVVDQVSFSEKVHALAGIRFDRIDTEDEADPSFESLEDSQASPMLGVVYAPTQRLSFYANASRSVGPPAVRVQPPGELEPEEGEELEVGAKVEGLSGRLQATLSLYHLRRENIGIPDDNGFTQQVGDQRSRGVELELAAEPMSGLRTFVSYAYTDAELTRFTERIVVGVDPNTFMPIFGTVDRTGNDPTFVPDHILNLWVTRKFDNGLGLAGGGRYVSDQFIGEDNSVSIDGYVTFDAAVHYTRDEWELSLNLKNLTGRDYETRALGSTSVLPAAPFAVYGGVNYRF